MGTRALLSILAASLVASAVPVFAVDGMAGHEGVKDECLLVAKNCADSVDSIMQRIERYHREIAKGTDVYSRDELRILEKKLNDTNRMLSDLELGG